MNKIKQPKIIIPQVEPKWKLVRERDGLTKQSAGIVWLEFNENGTFKSKHDEPAVGRSLVLSPFSIFFAWQTTAITEILEQTEDYLKFKTLNSTYELWKLS
jgi:hypothetical protein